jgi:AcrR family transcriptional regulator
MGDMAKSVRKRAARKVPQTTRKASQASDKRVQILAAALDEFSQNGFAAARLDDVARRANVAKGTIYLYFEDKEALFQELLRAEIGPVIKMLEAVVGARAENPRPLREIAHGVVDLFVTQVIETRRKDIVRLVLTEGPRFPKLAEFYYREVISRGLGAFRTRAERAVRDGELKSDRLARFPQLVVAPALLSVVWKSMFDRYEPLDVRAMMRAQIEILFDGEERS